MRVRPLGRRFGSDQRGAVVILVGLALPILFGAVASTVTYGQLAARRSELQKAADTAVLVAARELILARAEEGRVLSVARSVALANLSSTDAGSAEPKPGVLRNETGQSSGVEITITETVSTPLAKLLTMPSATLEVTSAARASGLKAKVCLIGLDDRMRGSVYLRKSAQITAAGCSLYSNSADSEGLVVEDNAIVVASLVCSAGGTKEGKKGVSVQPSPLGDCPPLPDPLSGRRPPTYASSCSGVTEVQGLTKVKRPKEKDLPATTILTDTGLGVELSPGLYCDGLLIHGGANVKLKPGIYVMRGPLIVDASSLSGQNVSFYFEGSQASLLFDYDSSVSLTAPKTGDMAGLLMYDDRFVASAVTAPAGKVKGKTPPAPPGAPPLREYRILSDDAQLLLGTIYLPGGRLVIDSDKPVAGKSAYTVVVARMIELFDGPNLVLNTNYGETDIPVPPGVGPTDQQSVYISK